MIVKSSIKLVRWALSVAERPFELISLDIAGPFKETKAGYKYILVCIDLLTNWVEAQPLTTI